MASRHVDILLIGGGIACATAAAELRAAGFDGAVALVAREQDPPYHRPPVTKAYLQGASSREDARVHPAGWWEEHGVELLTRTSVMALDTEERTATLQTREEVSWGQALVATGATVRRLRVAGAQLEGIHYLRTPGNADALRDDVRSGARVAVIGGSYIATEVAASLAPLGVPCAVVMQEQLPLERGFGADAGRWVRDGLLARGVEIHAGETVDRFEGDGERVRGLVTETGTRIEADVVVAGCGAAPDTMLAARAGLALGESGGVRCDAMLRTSAPGVYAAGDVCEYDSVLHGRRLRIEHEQVAADQGRTAARTMLGSGEPHTALPYFFSDLGDWGSLEYVGPAESWDATELRGSVEDGSFSVRYLDDGRLCAVLAVNRPGDLAEGRQDLGRSLRASVRHALPA